MLPTRHCDPLTAPSAQSKTHGQCDGRAAGSSILTRALVERQPITEQSSALREQIDTHCVTARK